MVESPPRCPANVLGDGTNSETQMRPQHFPLLIAGQSRTSGHGPRLQSPTRPTRLSSGPAAPPPGARLCVSSPGPPAPPGRFACRARCESLPLQLPCPIPPPLTQPTQPGARKPRSPTGHTRCRTCPASVLSKRVPTFLRRTARSLASRSGSTSLDGADPPPPHAPRSGLQGGPRLQPGQSEPCPTPLNISIGSGTGM